MKMITCYKRKKENQEVCSFPLLNECGEDYSLDLKNKNAFHRI